MAYERHSYIFSISTVSFCSSKIRRFQDFKEIRVRVQIHTQFIDSSKNRNFLCVCCHQQRRMNGFRTVLMVDIFFLIEWNRVTSWIWNMTHKSPAHCFILHHKKSKFSDSLSVSLRNPPRKSTPNIPTFKTNNSKIIFEISSNMRWIILLLILCIGSTRPETVENVENVEISQNYST